MTSLAAFSAHLSERRAAIRSSLTVAAAMELCKSVKTADVPNVGELLGRIAALQKALEALVFRAEEDPRVAENGTYFVNPDALTASGLLYPDFYTTMLETIKRTGAAGLMLTPTQADFSGEAGEFAETYFAGADGMPGSDRVQIAKLAWDVGPYSDDEFPFWNWFCISHANIKKTFKNLIAYPTLWFQVD